jgi:signal transduction histidine kinase
MVRPLIEKNGNTLRLAIDPVLGSMHADLTRVRQILLNLLSNASKFTEKGTVTLVATRELDDGRHWIVFEVHDTGIGMTPAQRERLFQPFTQADPSTTRKYGGTGLGLSITKRFCELMNGSIGVTSEPVEMPPAGNASPTNCVSSPAMMRNSELFPAPLTPSTPILAPGRNESQMSSRTLVSGG